MVAFFEVQGRSRAAGDRSTCTRGGFSFPPRRMLCSVSFSCSVSSSIFLGFLAGVLFDCKLFALVIRPRRAELVGRIPRQGKNRDEQQRGQEEHHFRGGGRGAIAPAPLATDPQGGFGRLGPDRLAAGDTAAGRRPALGRWRSAAPGPSAGTSGKSSRGRAAARLQAARRHRLLGEHLQQRVQRRRRPERRPARQQLVEDRPQARRRRPPGRPRWPCRRPAPGPCSWACP